MSEEIWFPYANIPKNQWKQTTKNLISEFPIPMDEIKNIVLDSWEQLFTISNDTKDLAIGKTIFPRPQILGFFLEEIVTQKISKAYPDTWQPDPTGYSKDLENLKDPKYSLEIKTSSSKKNIYGNRSYGQKGESSKKSKDGYYLAINFEKFDSKEPLKKRPEITMIRFGYLNYTDWQSQSSSTGQQSRIPADIESVKLLPIYKKP